MFARIENGTVVELWDTGALPPLAPGAAALYEPCGPEVEVGWAFDGQTFAPPPLAELQAQARARINGERDRRIRGGFSHTVAGVEYRFDSDADSEANILGQAMSAAIDGTVPPGFEWRTEDNQDVPMDAPAVLELARAWGAHKWVQHATARALKAQVDAATTPAAVAAVVWPEG
jgi:hypothetical protein